MNTAAVHCFNHDNDPSDDDSVPKPTLDAAVAGQWDWYVILRHFMYVHIWTETKDAECLPTYD